ncbi:MAG: OmpH family outer membrane protein [Treponema sp.]|nr:OmpH family outer membrane protein [Treponema sp.]
MLKRILFLFLLSVSGFSLAYSQQITRIAVVDLPRVYTSFFRESQAVRQWEERRAGLQREIDRRTRDIQNLKTRQADAIQRDDQNAANNLDREINTATENLRLFFQNRTEQLERERVQLAQSQSFLTQVNNEIKYIAESEGYSMVINLKDISGILWFSPSVDITEKLIQSLTSRSRN